MSHRELPQEQQDREDYHRITIIKLNPNEISIRIIQKKKKKRTKKKKIAYLFPYLYPLISLCSERNLFFGFLLEK